METAKDPNSPLTAKGEIPYIDDHNPVENQNNGNNHTDGMSTNHDSVPKDGKRKPASANTGSSDGDGILARCGRFSFPWLLTVSVVQLIIYLNKLYQDSAAVAVYFDGKDINYCVVSATCLLIPALIYIVYLVALYVKQQQEIERKEVGTRIVHGLLLVPWQIKGRVEVLHFSAQRICQRRKLTPDETEEKSFLERQASVLEFFEEFYAGFIQLLLQLYIIIVSLDKNIDSKALPGEIIASVLTLMSMLAAVRRKDDGILTGILSVTGWLCIMVSRAVAISLATTTIHGWMVLICFLHGVLVSLWVSSIAITSSKEAGESEPFSIKRKLAYFFLVFTVFGLPSLTYWPVMFQLKKRKRPLIFLFILLLENALFLALWYFLRDRSEWAQHDYVLTSLLVGGYIAGTLFILVYICCKPKYTDQVVYHDMKIRNADSFGMYFEFCDLTFCLPKTHSVEVKLQRVRAPNAAAAVISS